MRKRARVCVRRREIQLQPTVTCAFIEFLGTMTKSGKADVKSALFSVVRAHMRVCSCVCKCVCLCLCLCVCVCVCCARQYPPGLEVRVELVEVDGGGAALRRLGALALLQPVQHLGAQPLLQGGHDFQVLQQFHREMKRGSLQMPQSGD